MEIQLATRPPRITPPRPSTEDLVRRALRLSYPGTKFRLQTKTRRVSGTVVNVDWTPGPFADDVADILQMIDPGHITTLFLARHLVTSAPGPVRAGLAVLVDHP